MTQSPAIDVQAFIDQHKLSSFQILVIVLCFLIVAVDGFDIAAAGYIAPALHAQWGPGHAELAPMGEQWGFELSRFSFCFPDFIESLHPPR